MKGTSTLRNASVGGLSEQAASHYLDIEKAYRKSAVGV